MRRLILLLTLVACVLAVAAYAVWRQWSQPIDMPREGYYLEVSPGDTLSSLSRRLAADNVIHNGALLNWYGRFTGLDAKLHSGEYLLVGRLTPMQILERITRGDVLSYTLTLPEGITLDRALKIIQGAPGVVAELTDAMDPRLLDLAQGRESAEGLFLPETYRYERGTTDWDILLRAHRDLCIALGKFWAQRDTSLPYEEAYDALIMASIVERETGVASERGQVAGVFVRRLQQGMRLQTDPTIIYGLGERFDGKLTRAHLRDAENRFNTYRHSGLPPTPIALAGASSIRAALDPEEGTSLYFVARGDGTHEFNDTLEAHQRAVQRYQLQRRPDYRSYPPRE